MASNSWYSLTDGVMASLMDAVDSAMGGITGALTGLGSSAKELAMNTLGMVIGGNSPVDLEHSHSGDTQTNNAPIIEPSAASASNSQMAAIVSGLVGDAASVVQGIAENPLRFGVAGSTESSLSHLTPNAGFTAGIQQSSGRGGSLPS